MFKPLSDAISQLNAVILGKEGQIRLTLACMLAKGHLLIEDVPGVGKTVLAHALARVLGLQFQRIQFTSDLLPADILGISIFDRETSRFKFQPGPIFSHVILGDEVNRATPKAQSALLEAMEEHQVTVDGSTLALPDPFFVIATQNPSYQIGTFPLPESQLDRFLMRVHLGYPDKQAERALLEGRDRRDMIHDLQPSLHPDQLLQLQREVSTIFVAPALLDYVQALLSHSRDSPRFSVGLSPRAGLHLIAASKAWAFLADRREVQPEDVQAVLPGVAGHRIRLAVHSGQEENSADSIQRLITDVALP
jgi:MoxR-like ATPase